MDFLSVFFFKFYINLALTIFILETWEIIRYDFWIAAREKI